jgi:hypothetical protein
MSIWGKILGGVGGFAIGGPLAAPAARDIDACLIGCRAEGQHAIGERFRFVARHDFRLVLRIVTPRKRQGGHP